MRKKLTREQEIAMFAKQGEGKTYRQDYSKTAEDYGDDPKIRHSHGEHKSTHKEQYWEQRYKKQKKTVKKQPVKRQPKKVTVKKESKKGEYWDLKKERFLTDEEMNERIRSGNYKNIQRWSPKQHEEMRKKGQEEYEKKYAKEIAKTKRYAKKQELKKEAESKKPVEKIEKKEVKEQEEKRKEREKREKHRQQLIKKDKERIQAKKLEQKKWTKMDEPKYSSVKWDDEPSEDGLLTDKGSRLGKAPEEGMKENKWFKEAKSKTINIKIEDNTNEKVPEHIKIGKSYYHKDSVYGTAEEITGEKLLKTDQKRQPIKKAVGRTISLPGRQSDTPERPLYIKGNKGYYIIPPYEEEDD